MSRVGRTSRDAEFRELVAVQGPSLLRFARWLTGNDGEAEDLVQSALLRTYRRWESVRDQPVAYVRRAIVNAHRDRWRRIGRQRHVEPLPTSSADHQDAYAEQDLMRRALMRLTRKERAVVVLRHYFDLSEQDVALELGIALGSVKSTNARALAKLRATTTGLGDNTKERQQT
jgi:RNA polymerase sigma-70 factor (sigma-E family)